MEKRILIVLAIVLGLSMVGEARADGAWVLWEDCHYLADAQGRSDHENGKLFFTGWGIIAAYPSFPACSMVLISTCRKVLENMNNDPKKEVGEKSSGYCDVSDGSVVRVDKKSKLIIGYEWKCLPESVDPRK